MNDRLSERTNTISVYLLVCGDPKKEKYKKKKEKFSHQITNKYNFTIKKEKKITLN